MARGHDLRAIAAPLACSRSMPANRSGTGNRRRNRYRLGLVITLSVLAECAPAGQVFDFTHSTAASDDYIFVDSFESSDCSLPLTCSAPPVGKACIAGTLTDAATRLPLHATFNVGLTCGNGAIGGPCDLSVAAYDTVDFAGNPGAATPLSSFDTVVDGCGRFRFSSLTAPGSGSVAIVVADAAGSSGHVPTAALHPLVANQQLDGFDAPVTTSATLTSWSSLGSANFSLGAILLNYLTDGSPTAGVTAFRDGGGGSEIFRYFTDADSQRLFASSSATSTGADGSVLIANGSFTTYSGVGGESNGCHWTHATATSLAGIVVVADVACIP